MFRRALLLSEVILILSAIPIIAQEPYFYDGTRAMSMGKAFSALSDDENALFYNPAGLTRVKDRRVSLSGYIQQYSWEITVSGLEGFAPNFTDRGFIISYIQNRIGISYSLTGKGWWESFENGERDIYMPEGSPTSSNRPVNYEHCLTACYAHTILPCLDLGLTGKYLRFSPHVDSERLEDRNGFTFDLGLLLRPAERLSIGLGLLNAVSSDMNCIIYNDYIAVAYLSELPVNLTAGITWLPIDPLTVTADVRNILQDDVRSALNDYDFEFRRSWHLGIEWRTRPWMALRGGYYRCERPVERVYMGGIFDDAAYSYEYNTYNDFSFGAGFLYRKFTLDTGFKLDDRSSRMNESATTELRDSTVMGSVSVSYSF